MAQKGFEIFLILGVLSFLTIFGVTLVSVEQEMEGFDITINLEKVDILDIGQYKLTGNLEITNVDNGDIIINSGQIAVYTDESESFEIFSYVLPESINLPKGETYKSGTVSGIITLEDDNIPEKVFVCVDNFIYSEDGRIHEKSWSFWFDIDLEDYLP